MAKYPFLQETKEHVSKLDIDVEELEEVERIVERARERIFASFEFVSYFSQKPSKDLEVEIFSFPVSIMLVTGVKDNALTERFALHEAGTIFEYLRKEKSETILDIAQSFDWRIRETKQSPHPFAMHFINYLKNATRGRLVHSPEWKLVNRQLHKGEVHVSTREVCRLLQEEMKKYIEDMAGKKISTVPQNIQEVIDEIKSEFSKRKPHLSEFDKIVKAEESEYPPCIRIFLDRAVEGQHLSHTERFTLVTYLLHQGVSIDGVIKMFANVADFKENKTRYQVEHLAGQRGSQTEYRPYNCSTLKTHGACPDSDDPICHTIKSPLTYHLRKKPTEGKA
ncbi:MAG: DNA primase large subunit PriL [Candidatus Bathyarchaeota archaeon]|nr:MAG: DNA primase large subunit PriL [Candidatus Bathyarchaeota archaeon]